MPEPCERDEAGSAGPDRAPGSRLRSLSGALRRLAIAVLPGLLAGCAAPAVVGTAGIAGAGSLAVERRTVGTMVEDEAIEWRIRDAVYREGLHGPGYNINVTSFNRIALLTGQVPNEDSKRRAVARALLVAEIRSLHDGLKVGPTATVATRSADTLLTGRIRLALLGALGVPAPANLNVKVVTANGVVFVMGLVSRPEGEALTEAIRSVPGVREIVRLFEYREATGS